MIHQWKTNRSCLVALNSDLVGQGIERLCREGQSLLSPHCYLQRTTEAAPWFSHSPEICSLWLSDFRWCHREALSAARLEATSRRSRDESLKDDWCAAIDAAREDPFVQIGVRTARTRRSRWRYLKNTMSSASCLKGSAYDLTCVASDVRAECRIYRI